VELHLLSPVSFSPSPQEKGRFSGAAIVSMSVHALAALALVWFTYAKVQEAKQLQDDTPKRVVWVPAPGPAGGGGGSPKPAPPKVTPPEAAKVEIPKPVEIVAEVLPTPTPAPVEAPAAIVAETPTVGAVGNPGSAPGVGKGNGSGTGNGDGVGPGTNKGFGGGAYRGGDGVSWPQPTFRAKPQYTAEAMKARATGVITVECVVEPNGECGDVRVLQAFAPPYGLDQQALVAAKKWKFRPGTREGQPVPVIVNLAIEFDIR
jgi:protein TonB